MSGSTYTFREKGYAIDAPAGWQAQPNSVFDKVNSVFPSDAFFAPDVVGNAQANITITCQKPRNDQATLEQYRDARQALLRQIANVDVAPREVTVAGVPAFAFDYTEKISTQNISLDKTEVTLLTARCRWLITLSVPGGERAKYATLFDQALASLKFLG